MLENMRQFGTLGGVPVFVSAEAMTTEPRFPDKKWTKRRRRRVIGKYGSWFVRRPACFTTAQGMIMHPRIFERLRMELRENSN